MDKTKSYLSSRNESSLDAFTRTLVENNFAGSSAISITKDPKFEVLFDIISRFLQDDQPLPQDDFEKLVEDGSSYYDSMHWVSSERVLFTTNEGLIGLAPDTIISGDIMCAFLGANNPVLLRPCENGCYQVLGMCYVHGLMSNEAFLGPLPREFRLDTLENKPGQPHIYFDSKSSKFPMNDPRLGRLPNGWQFESLHPDQEFKTLQNFNQETGKKTYFDPRLTPEALKERDPDLKLEVFSLV
ncbi:hypothetical protein NHQ30_002895 [Ciborinia camelliae]|nr:hypothetical protein NHQ30_002895 [Ciborinia camelliae]